MQIAMLRGREITERDREGAPPVVVVSDRFARNNFGGADPIGRRIAIAGTLSTSGAPLVLEIVGIAANAKYGAIKRDTPPVVYVPYAQLPPARLGQMTYAIRTEGDPLRFAGAVRQVVQQADARVPVSGLRTQAADIDQTINQEILFARLCSAFAILAMTIACVGLYATMAYAAARRTSEIGLRLALGAGRGAVIWMMLRDVCVLAMVGLAIGASAAVGASRTIESFLFHTAPNDPRAIVLPAVILMLSALAAGYGPAWRASRVDPLTALRHD
jgi:macrolide transport system ATP-binding/permease protein